jgi:hypothetical protein
MPRKTAVAILVFGFTLWICGRGPHGATILAILRERIPEKPVGQEPIEKAGTTILPSVGELWLDSTGSMHTFYESLLRTEQHQADAITRILHYGDSPTTGDLITADVRAMTRPAGPISQQAKVRAHPIRCMGWVE